MPLRLPHEDNKDCTSINDDETKNHIGKTKEYWKDLSRFCPNVVLISARVMKRREVCDRSHIKLTNKESG